MCGQYFLSEEEYELQQLQKGIKSAVKMGVIHPTEEAAVIMGAETIGAESARWGFPKYGGRSGVIINARAETAFQKPMFKESANNRRCIVPASGFFEWERRGKEKDKYYIRKPGEAVIYMAGLWKVSGGKKVFVILTTESNETMIADESEQTIWEKQPIHDRMPVILERGECEEWLTDMEYARKVLRRSGTRVVMSRIEEKRR